MTVDTFRQIALGMTGAVEGAHMGHPDFRVNGKVFAALRPDGRGVVKLTPDDQARLVAGYPEMFVAETGAWGRQGYTRVHLEHADAEVVGEAMTNAWRTVSVTTASRRTKPRR